SKHAARVPQPGQKILLKFHQSPRPAMAKQSKLAGFLLATWLLGIVATESRISEPVHSLHEHEIVYPRVIPAENARNKRSAHDRGTPLEDLEEQLIFLGVNNWTLRTVANDRLTLSSNFTVNWVHSSGTKFDGYHGMVDCDLRQGGLTGDENSFAVVTLCKEELYALVLIGQRSFFVQPLTNGQHVIFQSRDERWWSATENSNFVSVTPANPPRTKKSNEFEESNEKTKRIKRSSDHDDDPVNHDVQGFYNLSGDVFDVECPEAEKLIFYDEKDEIPTEYNDTIVEELSIDVNPEEIEHFSGPKWQRTRSSKKRPTAKGPPPRWLEIGIAADYSVIDFHGIRVQQYIMALLNIVRHGDARRSLENVNKWNRKMLSSTDANYDVAVWLTRLDIGGPSGYAPVSGVCDPARSCALNRDEGLTSAFIIAHEVAHILGLTHDGDETTGNACKEEGSRGSVMAPMVAATFHHFYWSACSRKEFHRRVRRWPCLSNKPKNDGFGQLKTTVQETFTMDEQCRMEFGEGYEHCKTFDVAEPCSHLWCGNSNVSERCKTKKGPPLEGTLCGSSKWCINGRCQSTNRKKFDIGTMLNKPRDGDWSAWSAWDKCSRTCGIGVQCRTRKCNKPLPAYGGKYCSGPSDDCRLCDLPKCLTSVDLRAQQCAKLGNVLHAERVRSNNDVTWLPYASEQENLKCRLICRSKETGEIFYTRKHLIDGTPCSYGSTDICVQ
ncbi:unnamed protein product, partial [Heterotrigona itama]